MAEAPTTKVDAKPKVEITPPNPTPVAAAVALAGIQCKQEGTQQQGSITLPKPIYMYLNIQIHIVNNELEVIFKDIQNACMYL